MIIVPNKNKKFFQNNRSDILGNLRSTFNIDLQSNLGRLRISPRLQINTSGVSNQGLSTAFESFDRLIFTLAGTRVFKNTAFNFVNSFVEDTSSGAITTYDPNTDDMKVFSSAFSLCTTADQKLMSKALDANGTGAWTQRASLAQYSLHKLCYFKKFDRMYYLDNFTQIKSIDPSWSEATSGDYFIDIGLASGIPLTMESDSDWIWIGTANTSPSYSIDNMHGASILKWDGISSQVTAVYNIKAQGILAMCKDDNGTIHAIDTNGALLAFNGAGFKEIDRLPLNRSLLTFSQSTVFTSIAGGSIVAPTYTSFIHPNGFYYTKNGTFIVNINNQIADNASSIKENLPSGIWEYHKDTGFLHRQSLSYNPMTTTTITDYGQNRISQAGALYEPNISSNSIYGKPTLICGANYFTDASTVASGIFIDDPLNAIQKYGYFVTDWIESANAKDTWQHAWTKIRQFLDADDKIILKYRLTEAAPVEITGTWASTTTFTTSPTNVDMGMVNGYEVEIIQGTGSGKCAHISSVSGTGPYTVTLDETFTGVTSGTMKCRLQKWIRIGSYSGQNSEVEKFSIDKNSHRVQIKVCLQFTGDDEFHELSLTSKVFQPLV